MANFDMSIQMNIFKLAIIARNLAIILTTVIVLGSTLKNNALTRRIQSLVLTAILYFCCWFYMDPLIVWNNTDMKLVHYFPLRSLLFYYQVD